MRAYQITNLVESFKDAKLKFTNEVDEHTVDTYIDAFKELSKRNIIKGADKDIGKWIKAGWEEFKKFVDDAKEQNSNRDIKKKRVNKSGEYITLIDNDEYTAVVPLTERSSCYYGKKTNWCVSVVSEDNMFDAYVAAGKFPVHIMKGGEIYSLVYSFIRQDITEYRDAENKEYSAYMFKEHIVDPQPIINKILAHEDKLMKLSESKRLKTSKTAIYYALHKQARFEEGEELIAQNFVYSLNYMVKCLRKMNVPVIDKKLLSDISEIENYSGNKRDARYVMKDYLEIHYVGRELPSYADEDYIMKTFPTYYLKHMIKMDEVLSETAFSELIEYVDAYHKDVDVEDDGSPLVPLDFKGTESIGMPLKYMLFLHNNEHDTSGYIETFFEKMNPGKDGIVEFIRSEGYFVGFSDELIKGLGEKPISFTDVWKIVNYAPNGEYIFTLLKPSNLTPEMLYKLAKVNQRIFTVIGEVPQKLIDYVEEEGLSLPKIQ